MSNYQSSNKVPGFFAPWSMIVMDVPSNFEWQQAAQTMPARQSGPISGDNDRTQLAAMRPAKLLCESGEYVCLIRDVSEAGVTLGLFHDMPAISHAFLELANGEVFPLLGLWAAERQAGFRFTQPLDPAELIAEPGSFPRRAIRLNIPRSGMVFADGLLRGINLQDIAQNGASFTSDTRFALGQTLVLSLDAIPEMSAWVRWRRGRAYGLVFDTMLRLDQLAHYALALQPVTSRGHHETVARVA